MSQRGETRYHDANYMKRHSFLVSLTNNDNDYQIEQATAAKDSARRLGVDLYLAYAENDAITQSQQLLKAIQSPAASRPDAIVLEPVGGTGLPQVARAAAAAGIGWVVLNCDVHYIAELRKSYRVPVFAITSDHLEIGRIQGRQFAALLPKGGTVLYIQGPSGSPPAQQRTAGMSETKPANIQIRMLKGQWTELSAYQAVCSWLGLRTSHDTVIGIVAAQDDSMAIGARKAFQEQTAGAERDKWLGLPYLGCDGLPDTGQAWVRSSLLSATVVVPPNAGTALEMLLQAMRDGSQPQERTLTLPKSFPTVEDLAAKRARFARAMSV